MLVIFRGIFAGCCVNGRPPRFQEMTYLVFLVVLLLAAIVVGVARLFGIRISFELAFKILANVVLMLPAVTWALLVWLGMALGLVMIASGILYAAGLLPAVAGWPMWKLLPFWLWLAIAAVLLFGTGHLYYWARDRHR
jgi:hypothetical protein